MYNGDRDGLVVVVVVAGTTKMINMRDPSRGHVVLKSY